MKLQWSLAPYRPGADVLGAVRTSDTTRQSDVEYCGPRGIDAHQTPIPLKGVSLVHV